MAAAQDSATESWEVAEATICRPPWLRGSGGLSKKSAGRSARLVANGGPFGPLFLLLLLLLIGQAIAWPADRRCAGQRLPQTTVFAALRRRHCRGGAAEPCHHRVRARGCACVTLPVVPTGQSDARVPVDSVSTVWGWLRGCRRVGPAKVRGRGRSWMVFRPGGRDR